MKKSFISFLLFMGLSSVAFAYEFQMSLIASEDLHEERQLFMNFWQPICLNNLHGGETAEDVLLAIAEAIDEEEADYLAHSGQTFFVHAVFMGQVIGYISFNVNAESQASIRMYALDKDMSDESLIKALILSIFDYVPQCKKLSMDVCPAFTYLIKVMQGLGFVLNPETFGLYELVVADRCQMCVAMNGADFWERDLESDDDSNDDAANGSWGSYDVDIERAKKAERGSGG